MTMQVEFETKECIFHFNRKYVYYFTRQDITPVQQAIQAGHALFGLGTIVDKKIDPDQTYFQWIGVKDGDELLEVIKIHNEDLACFYFQEPDLGNIITAVAFEPVLWNKRDKFMKYSLLNFTDTK